MKKIISFALSLIMLISMFSITAAADYSTTEYNEAESFAFALGIADTSSYKPGAYITRAEFCALVHSLLTAGKPGESSDKWQDENFGEDTKDEIVINDNAMFFDDVDTTVPEYYAIKYMAENGFVSGMTERNFGPGYNITVAAVAKVMINILGYDFMARDNGGFPNGYMLVANKIKILTGITAGANDFVTMRDCLNIFYNCLDVQLFDIDYISGEGELSIAKGEDSFLTAGLGLVNIQGLVSDTGITTVYGASKVGKDKAVIDGVRVDVGSCTQIRSYIGREVSAYCYYDKNGKYILKHLQVIDDNALTFDAADFVSFASGRITYVDERGSIETANTVSRNKLKVIYNGKAVTNGYSDSIFQFPFGDITLVATGGGAYDLAVIRDYKTAMVSKVRASDMYIYGETLYNDMDAVKYLNLDPKDVIVDIRNSYGEMIEASAIAKGDVISALISSDGEYVDAVVSSSVISGFVVDSVSETTSDIIYISGSNEYVLSCRSELTMTPAVEIGKAHNMYFDHKGRLVYIEIAGEDTSGEKAAFITGVNDTLNGLKADYKIRLYTEDGLMVIYDFDEKVMLNGASRLTRDVISVIKAAGDAQKAILYTADTKTKIIKSIILPLEFGAVDTDNRGWYHISPDQARLSLYENETATDTSWKDNEDAYALRWHIDGYALGRLMFWNQELTKTMSVPNEVARYDDERDFRVSTGTVPFTSAQNFQKFLVHGYSRDQEAMIPELFVYAPKVLSAQSFDKKSCLVLESIVNTLDRDDEPVMQLTGYEIAHSRQSSKRVSYTVDENTVFCKADNTTIEPDSYDITVDGPAKIEDLAPGDIISYAKTSSDVLTSIHVIYDEDQNLHFFPTPTISSPFVNDMDIAVGYPLYVSGTYVRLLNTDYLPQNTVLDASNLTNPAILMAHYVSSGERPVVVVDKSTRKTTVRVGSLEDILTYEDTGTVANYQRIVGVLYVGHAMGTVIYNPAN